MIEDDDSDRYRAPALDKGLDILELLSGIDGGLTIPDQVFVDFSENGNGVFCPNLELEILTPLPALVSA